MEVSGKLDSEKLGRRRVRVSHCSKEDEQQTLKVSCNEDTKAKEVIEGTNSWPYALRWMGLHHSLQGPARRDPQNKLCRKYCHKYVSSHWVKWRRCHRRGKCVSKCSVWWGKHLKFFFSYTIIIFLLKKKILFPCKWSWIVVTGITTFAWEILGGYSYLGMIFIITSKPKTWDKYIFQENDDEMK